jgi:hypothetical protein
MGRKELKIARPKRFELEVDWRRDPELVEGHPEVS